MPRNATIPARKILSLLIQQPLTLRLFRNEISPAGDETPLDFDEVTGGGYKAVPLITAAWVIEGNLAKYPPVTFVFTGQVGQVNGYYVTLGSDEVLFAESFGDTAPFIRTAGDEIEVTPRLWPKG